MKLIMGDDGGELFPRAVVFRTIGFPLAGLISLTLNSDRLIFYGFENILCEDMLMRREGVKCIGLQ